MDIQSIISSFEGSGGVQQAAANAGVKPGGRLQPSTQAALEHADAGGGMEGMVDAVAQRAGRRSGYRQPDPAAHHAPAAEPPRRHRGCAGRAAARPVIMGMVGGLFGPKT